MICICALNTCPWSVKMCLHSIHLYAFLLDKYVTILIMYMANNELVPTVSPIR